MFLVVAYDVPDDRRRNRLAKELENWGARVQASVFECDLDEARTAALIDRLRQIAKDEDDLRVYRLCQGCLGKSAVIRGGRFAVDPDFYQV